MGVATCGWSFPDWKGVFYPTGTKDELAFYATRFDAVETGSTWYRIPSARTVASWHKRTPDGFLFCPKLPGEITHERMLDGAEDVVATFLDVIAGLQEKLGPILVQLHPSFRADQFPKLEAFLSELPQESRYVAGFRHRSWVKVPAALALLRSLNMEPATAHHPCYPRFQEAATGLAYLRLLGRRGVLPDFSRVHQPRDDALREWAGVLLSTRSLIGRAYVSANNRFEGYSPSTIERLRAMV